LKWKLDDVPVFVAVVDTMGITAAAEALNMPKSTVSTAISRLEQGLGLKLLERTSRNLRVTEEGDAFYRRAQHIMEQVREADATLAGMHAEPQGRLTVALPPAFCQEIVAPRISAFQAQFPNIDLEIITTADGFRLLNENADVAVVVGPLEDSEYISKTLLAGPLIWVTSPDYLARHRIGPDIDAIRSHVRICESRYGLARMPVHTEDRRTHIDLAHGISHVNDPLVVRRAVLAGAGLAPLPRHYCRDHIAEGTLVEVCGHVKFDRSASSLTVVYPSRKLLSPRTRAFVDFRWDLSC